MTRYEADESEVFTFRLMIFTRLTFEKHHKIDCP